MSQASLALPDLPGIGDGWELCLPAPERARRCTAEQAVASEERREAIVAACVHLGTRRVAEAFNVSREVVRVLRAEAVRTGKLDHLKEEMGRRALAVSDRVLDRIEDEVDRLPVQSLAITYGILKDKGLLLTGQPTSRVEHVKGLSHADLNDMIDALPVAAQPVYEGDPSTQKGGHLLGPAAAQVGVGDSQSPVSAHVQRGPMGAWPEGGQKQAEKGGAS